MLATLGVVVAWTVCWVSAGGAHSQPLSIPGCCPAGLSLDLAALSALVITPAAVPSACVPQTDLQQKWVPLVYGPVVGRFLERGRLPAQWKFRDATVPNCKELQIIPEHAAAYALLRNDGSLMMIRSRGRALALSRYCTDAAAALVCAEDVTHTLSKCCGEGRVFDGGHCILNESKSVEVLAELRKLANGTVVGGGWPTCVAGLSYGVTGALSGAVLMPDGALELSGTKLEAGAWCAEAVVGEEGTRILTCEAVASAVVPRRTARHALYGAGLAVGAAFLAATLAAGFALPAAHHALHWRCQTHYVAALMLGDVLLAATQLADNSVPPTLCRALAVCMHFLFLSAFFWLNTMCFNIWWTFRDFRPTSLERGQEAWRLRVYMVYAWGGPLLVAGTGALLDHLPAGAAPLLRPRFAVQRCWFYGDMEILVYFFGPVGVLLLVNLALFISTTRQLTCGLWRRDEVKSTSERAALGRVCAKLVVVMGVTWGADVVSWAAGGPEYVWYATDLLNALQGVLIFLVVGCQPHAWAALKRCAAACCAKGGSGGGERGAGRHSSTHLPSCGESLTHTTQAAAPAPAPVPTPRVPMETVC
ncbi:probable G-protein coupled receptor Mth-like 1 [Bombyx mandarina]|uniref:Probable G-protein coupled receptor Mth-like 1 n=1 Tax=Bombyx mandarina TaxID=7092 RepID=A0A6J2JKP3_BOMMA|nr:probable G-protein coupled receptor Mth-like 1 [Bombyx mandarina]